MKKIGCVLLVLFIAITSAFAVEVSVGGSLNLGLPVLGGENYDAILESFDDLEDLGLDVNDSAFAIAPQFDVLIMFTPNFALETGLGFLSSKKFGEVTYLGENMKVAAVRNQMTIPLLGRGSYEYPVSAGVITSGVSYISTGLKLSFAFGDYYIAEINMPSAGLVDTAILKAASVIIDFTLAIGQEFKIGSDNCVGLRIGYDFNITDVFETHDGVASSAIDLKHNNLLFGVTYRYMF